MTEQQLDLQKEINLAREILCKCNDSEDADCARIVTHCLYPSFERVYVYVGKADNAFYVHDGRGAYDSGWEHGRDEADVASAIRDEALRYHLRVSNDHRLTMEPVTSEWLPSAILAVANASAAAANAAVARAAIAKAKGEQ